MGGGDWDEPGSLVEAYDGGSRLLLISGDKMGVRVPGHLAAIDAAEQAGLLRSGQTVVEYTGGSTGISLALVCAARGYPIRIVTSDAFAVARATRLVIPMPRAMREARSSSVMPTPRSMSRSITPARRIAG